MTEPQRVPADYRGRDKMSLVEFVEDVEKVHFRTPYDSGANPNAMFIWNIVRQQAGLDRLTLDDLIQNHADLVGETFDEVKAAYNEHRSAQRRALTDPR